MTHFRASVLLALAVTVPTGAQAQLLVSETVEGIHRLCYYSTGPFPDRRQTYRIGLAQNCPGTYPILDRSSPAPPTASLVRQGIEEGRRTCVYAQDGRSWQFQIPFERYCPLSAGMVDRQEQGE